MREKLKVNVILNRESSEESRKALVQQSGKRAGQSAKIHAVNPGEQPSRKEVFWFRRYKVIYKMSISRK